MAFVYPTDLRYTKDHEWTRASGKSVTVGITAFATDQLGDVVFVELPKVGAQLKNGEPFGTVESTKAVSELYSPVTGTVTKVNDALASAPETVNTDPYGGAWMIEVEVADEKELGGLMTAEQYQELTKG